MVMEAPPGSSGSKKAARRADAQTTAAAPIVAPAPVSAVPAPAATFTEIPWTRIDLDLYEVARDGYIVGYVEVVGAVFVALGGTRYDRSVELSQHLTFHAAVDALLRRSV
ncbi:hypothetical protein [Microbacterium trichothecenolyticum]|uniref:Uncharacterized protein n=1 Tax=Microbacterium trichothecenolyticum TaxID=69370 RepID=A0ABU0TYK7_MICTR|nr:hypothetical protein [Microbacterium trichothecenolyticum]MDQ1124728.1 hypothetical protein [Microbacterium trichothecenolyticum]